MPMRIRGGVEDDRDADAGRRPLPPDATVYRALKRNGRVLERNYQAERRQHEQGRRAAFVVPPSGPDQVWQCDFTEIETRMGGTWRIGGIADYWSKLELGYHDAEPPRRDRDG